VPAKTLMNMCCTFYTESKSGLVNFPVHNPAKKFEKSTCTQHVYLFNVRGANHLQKKAITVPGFDCLLLSDLCNLRVENRAWVVITWRYMVF